MPWCSPGTTKILWEGDNKQTDGHCNYQTKGAQWADSVKSEKKIVAEKADITEKETHFEVQSLNDSSPFTFQLNCNTTVSKN